jgi:Piwi domain
LEVAQIKAAIESASISTTKLVFINVCKRVNTRLFAQGELEGTYKNPIPGMVVNSGIIEKKMKEFYLVSTASR